MEARRRWLGLGSGIGLIMANMIGAGVLLSTGFMAQQMGPGAILLAWLAGGGLALCGAMAYADVARLIQESGGEYRYLSRMWHPLLGSLAGWGSLLLGFSAPVAIDAFAIGAFTNTLVDGPDPRILGTLVIGFLTLAHATRRDLSHHTQNLLIALKVGLLVSFIVLGLFLGEWRWPDWQPPDAVDGGGFPIGPFLENQYWIAFAFSGWNAAIYVSGEFHTPERDVPRALLIGCGGVALLYLVVNWIFVANLTPAELSVVFEYDATRVTLGHALVEKMGSALGADAVSLFAILAFTSAMSAMMMVGPRVYAEMARDGHLPARFASETSEPPMGSVFLQGALAIGLLWTHSVLEAVESAGGVLLLFSMLTALGLLRLPGARLGPRMAGLVYTLGAGGILAYGVANNPHQLWWLVALLTIGAASYTVRRQGDPTFHEA
ncbi:MAG: amino acid permease [Myxococcota bacterium]